jgi:hypothetical protein
MHPALVPSGSVGFSAPQLFVPPEGDLVENELLNNAFGFDLMISLFYSAVWASDKRRLDLFFPSSSVNPLVAPQLLGFVNQVQCAVDLNIFFIHMSILSSSHPQQENNYDLLQQVVNLIPPVVEMLRWAQVRNLLEENLNKIHVLLYPLLVWLITDSSCRLRLLARDEIPTVPPLHLHGRHTLTH